MIYTLRILIIGMVVSLVQVYFLDLFSFKLNLVLLVLYLISLKVFRDFDSPDLAWLMFLGLEFLKSDLVGIYALVVLIIGSISQVFSKNLNPTTTKFIELNLFLIIYYALSKDFSFNLLINMLLCNLLFISVQLKNYAYPKSAK